MVLASVVLRDDIMACLDDASFGASPYSVVHAVLQAASRKNHATCLFVFTRTKARRMLL